MQSRSSMQKQNKTSSSPKTQFTASEASSGDIVELILEDHKPLKELIAVMKDTEKSEDERAAAFGEFAPLLVAHAKPEERSLYEGLKKSETEELRVEGFEGEVEHTLADQLLEELKRTENNEVWMAKVKVLAELVEHHIKEEEKNMLPNYKKNSSKEEREEIGELFLKLKEKIEAMGSDDAPPESLIEH